MWLVENPQDYDVIVTTNLFGDILSDLCAQLVGGMGFGNTGNIGERYAVFEPTHISARSREASIARNVQMAVADVIQHGAARTYDMGGKTGTMEMARAIAESMRLAHVTAK